jgi:hypothetical protein
MTEKTITHTDARWRQRLLRSVALVLALAAGLYGVLAINTGVVNIQGAGNAEVAFARQALMQGADSNDPSISPQAILGPSGLYFAIMSALTSARYAQGSQGLGETLLHYAEMPMVNGLAMGFHNLMGGLLMLFGGLQFWPALRRRHPRAHRIMGVVYVVSATLGMIAAIFHLVSTPVENIYDTFTFAFGLWMLAVGVLLSIGLSMYHLGRRQIAQHQAYMAISYGFLLTAPVQRYLWLAIGMWNPDMRQLEGNYAVTALLIPWSLLIAYGLFTANRLIQDRKSAARMAASQAFLMAVHVGRYFARALLPVSVLAIMVIVQHFVIAPGLGHHPLASTLIPAGVIAIDESVIGRDAMGRWLFAGATSIGLLLGLLQWRRMFVRQASASPLLGMGLALSAVLVGTVMARWGVSMGMPSFATLAGGANWLCGGMICIALALAMTWAVVTREEAWTREWSVWTVILLLGVPAFYALLPVFDMAGIPEEYRVTGHAYRMASYGQWFLLIPAFVYSAYGRATQERHAR